MPTPVPPRPTAAPTPVAPPPRSNVTQGINDTQFVGDFPSDGTYHGRSASWVYGQGTPYNTMSTTFTLDAPGGAIGRASLQLVGLDGENPVKNQMRVVLNGTTLYEGPNPLPDYFCCGTAGPGNWGSVTFKFPAELLQPQNTLSITNLEPNDCTSCTKFVMLDYAELSYKTQG